MGLFDRLVARIWRAFRSRPLLPVRSTQTIVRAYVLASCEFADRVLNADLYPKAQVETALYAWELAEREYAERGFRTLPLPDFIDHVAWAVPLPGVGVRREEGEPLVLHAHYYRSYCTATRGSVRDVRGLLLEEGVLDYDPSRRIRRLQS